MMMNNVTDFMSMYVPESRQPEAHSVLRDLFVQMHSDLARNFFDQYQGPTKPAAAPRAQPGLVVNLDAEAEEAAAPAEKKKKKTTTGPIEKKICCGVTAKGVPCKNKAFESGELCRVHQKAADKPAAAPKEKAVRKPATKKAAAKKSKKVAPEHGHALTEEAVDDCDLCQTHGNALDPALPAAEFEAVDVVGGAETDSIKSRLAAILNQFDEPEAEEPEAEEPEAEEPEAEEPEAEELETAPEPEELEPETEIDFAAALNSDAEDDDEASLMASLAQALDDAEEELESDTEEENVSLPEDMPTFDAEIEEI
jgi:hypothetical protein